MVKCGQSAQISKISETVKQLWNYHKKKVCWVGFLLLQKRGSTRNCGLTSALCPPGGFFSYCSFINLWFIFNPKHVPQIQFIHYPDYGKTGHIIRVFESILFAIYRGIATHFMYHVFLCTSTFVSKYTNHWAAQQSAGWSWLNKGNININTNIYISFDSESGSINCSIFCLFVENIKDIVFNTEKTI